jgi:hypothetical protein
MTNDIHIQPKNPEAARAEIEKTRVRMSETIDEIEEVLLRTKEDIQGRFDIRARIREKPLHAAGVVVGAGFLPGFLTGGDKVSRGVLGESERAALWEARARRLLAIARDQEEELDELESALVDFAADDLDDDWDDDPDAPPSAFAELRHEVVDWAGSLAEDAARNFVEAIRRRR